VPQGFDALGTVFAYFYRVYILLENNHLLRKWLQKLRFCDKNSLFLFSGKEKEKKLRKEIFLKNKLAGGVGLVSYPTVRNVRQERLSFCWECLVLQVAV